MNLGVHGLPTSEVESIRRGGLDSNGQPALVRVSDGVLNPCRHCLGFIAEGDEKLVLGYRPFAELQPYAETGPIFLHKQPCERYESQSLPIWSTHLDPAIVRGYGENHWIRYETGDAVPGKHLAGICRSILSEPTIAYVHIRSKFNCFQCRVDRD